MGKGWTPGLYKPLAHQLRPLVVVQADTDRGAQGVALAARHRIGAIVGGVEGARPVVARQADAAEGRGGGGTVGRAVPVDDAGARIGPELVVELGRPADQRGGEAEGGVVGLGDRSEEHTSELQSLKRIS